MHQRRPAFFALHCRRHGNGGVQQHVHHLEKREDDAADLWRAIDVLAVSLYHLRLAHRLEAYFEDIGNAVVVHKQLHLGAVGGSEHGVDLVGRFDCDRRLHGQ